MPPRKLVNGLFLFWLANLDRLEGLPEGIGRKGGFEADVEPGDGVYEVDGAGHERDGAVGVGASITVLEITSDGATDGRKLRAYLMLAPGHQVDFEQVISVRLADKAISEPRFFGSGALAGGDI